MSIGAGSPKAVYEKYIDIATLTGLPADDEDNQSVIDSSPAADAGLCIGSFILNGGTPTLGSTAWFNIRIVYYAELFKPKQLDA